MRFASLNYLVKKRLNLIMQIDQHSTVLNNFMNNIGLSGFGGGGRYSLIIIGMAIATFVSVFYFDRRKGTTDFLLSVPMGIHKQALIRGGTTLLILDSMILIVTVGTLAVMRLVDGHMFGAFQYPIVVEVLNATKVFPLWQIWCSWFVMCNLWFVLIAVCSYTFSMISQNELVGLAMLMIMGFANQLNLLKLLPVSLAQYLPGYFDNFPRVVLHSQQFSNWSMIHVILIFGGWITIFAIVAVGVSKRREHPFFAGID